mmetsp:Transcript_1162/g.1212  ORF Transcript_1162/g.1212 Transcript_1162/m.1212 type:complete len:255 (+) Transcript_1162:145-909(+)
MNIGLRVALFLLFSNVSKISSFSPSMKILTHQKRNYNVLMTATDSNLPRKYESPVRSKIVKWIDNQFSNFLANSPLKPIILSLAALASTFVLFEASKLLLVLGVPMYFTFELLRYSAKAPKYIDTVEVKRESGSSSVIEGGREREREILDDEFELKTELETYSEKLEKRNQIINSLSLSNSQSELNEFDSRLRERKLRLFQINRQLRGMRSDLTPLQASVTSLKSRVRDQLREIEGERERVKEENKRDKYVADM